MAFSVAETPVTDEPDPPRRPLPLWLTLVAVVLIAALVTSVAVLATSPRLTAGSFYVTTPTAKVANNANRDSKFVVVGGAGGVVHGSVRNPSRVPVTILGLATTPQTPSSLRGISFDPDPFGPGVHGWKPARVVPHVTLGHDQEAGVMLDVRFPDCVPYEQGSSAIFESIPLRVRRLGVTHTVRMPLALPLWVTATTDHEATGSCPG